MTAVKTERLKTIDELYPVLTNMQEAVILDIETTGFSPEKFAEIIEIGAVKLDIPNRKITGKFSQFVQPSNLFNIPKKITELTNIHWSDVEGQPYIEEVLPKFAKFLGDTPVVAHNATFDWVRFLVPLFKSVGLHATNEAICSMQLAKYLHPDLKSYKLDQMCELYGCHMEGHHRAWVDCQYTASLFLKLLDEYLDKNQMELWKEQKGADLNILPSQIGTVDFSKLKITKISPYESPSKKQGTRYYAYTNFGKLYYSTRKNLWTVQELWTNRNAPAQTWGNLIAKRAKIF